MQIFNFIPDEFIRRHVKNTELMMTSYGLWLNAQFLKVIKLIANVSGNETGTHTII